MKNLRFKFRATSLVYEGCCEIDWACLGELIKTVVHLY
jgi:hypothetical protein